MNTISLLLSLIPAIIYILLLFSYYRMYTLRRKKISAWLSNPILQEYYKAHDFRTFSKKDESSMFSNIIGYSGISVIISVLITIVVVWIVTVLTLAKFKVFCSDTFQLECYCNGLLTNPDCAINNYAFTAAFGAYFWGLFEFLKRYQQRDWTPVIQHQIWLRIPIAMFIASFTPQIFTSTTGFIVAFGIGAFPLETLRKWLMDKTSTSLTIGGTIITVEPPNWNLLQGISVQMIERLQELSIENPIQLANANPMNIYIRTNIEWRQILDLIDQAILVSYLGDKSVLLRELGIRGSIELAVLHNRAIDNEKDTEKLVKQIAAILKTSDDVEGYKGEDLVWNLIANLYEDSQVSLIWELWNTEEDSDGEESENEDA